MMTHHQKVCNFIIKLNFEYGCEDVVKDFVHHLNDRNIKIKKFKSYIATFTANTRI